ALDEDSGELVNIKIPSTPRKPADGVIQAFQQFLKNVQPRKVSVVTHATTIAVNALLGQLGLKIPKVASVSTGGFRDVLEIGRQRRHELYNLFIQKPQTLIPRQLRYEVNERVSAKGEVLEPLNKGEVHALAEELKQKDVEAVAVTLLFSYVNPKHEREIEKTLSEALPEIFVSMSSNVTPEHREYERTSTTVVNACLMPIVSSYLNNLANRVRKLGVTAPLCVMQSDGGLATKETVVEKPVSMVESGPAAGVVASSFYGERLGLKNVLSFDMGGTTAKAGTVQGGKPEVVMEYEVAGKIHSGRIVKGSGYPVRFPFIDLAECSAGGGTIAWTDLGGVLRVGPVSAGANPGPACYGKGGQKPTVTDANLLLGRLNPEYMLGGKMRLFADLSRRAVEKEICEKIGLKLEEAAAGIIKIVNSQMAKILRIVSVERGYDPRKFTLTSFGGAGPMHACALAEELHISKIVVPPNPGLFSAYGLLTTNFTCNFVQAVMKTAEKIEYSDLEKTFNMLHGRGVKTLVSQGVKPENMKFSRQLDMRYFGQGYELTVPAPTLLTERSFQQVLKSFHRKHEAIYGYAREGVTVEVVNARLTAVGLVKRPKLKKQEPYKKKLLEEALSTMRNVFFEKYDGFEETPVYIREKLKCGNFISGPAVVEQYDATTVVYPDWEAEVDGFGNIVLTVSEGG
ncbi:MAG: hydantoinase/oxoprolinase family protein, partial [Thermoproteota archaeon]|nr:hydantoinase/oxoprolinase family protein [Thermoproteota archaeon]